MRPIFQIFADGADITSKLRDRLLMLKVNDEAGMKSDTVDISLDDRDGAIALPPKGAELAVYFGYQETGVTPKGIYTVDELELSGPPETLNIRGKAADMRRSLKQQKRRAWDQTTLGDIIKTISSEHQLQPRISVQLAAIPITHIDQTDESDMNLLTRLGRQFGAVAKPAGPYLVFVPQGEAKSASGRLITPVIIDRKYTASHRVTIADRGKYGACIAHWHDTTTGQPIEERVGSGEPVYTLRQSFSDAVMARQAAIAKLEALNRGTATLSLSLQGNAMIAAEARLTLTGFRDGISGDWIVTKVTHQISNKGFTTNLEAETPNNK